MKKEIAYIMGPMSGYPNENREAFRAAARWAREFLNVDEVISADELDTTYPVDKDKPTWEDYIRRDLPHVARATIAIALPGWESSRGATLEATIFKALRVPVKRLALVASVEDHPDGTKSAHVHWKLEPISDSELPFPQYPGSDNQ